MPSLDIFNADPFSLIQLTIKVNKLPFVPGQIGQLGLFDAAGVSTTMIQIEESNGSLALVADSPRGGPGEAIAHEKRNLRPVSCAHFQRDDAIFADEVQNLRSYDGGMADFATVDQVFERKMARHFRDFDTTIEHLRIGAIKGIVASKNSVLLNLFHLFDIQPLPESTWALSDPTFDPRRAASDIQLEIEDELEATDYTGLHAFCGAEFFAKLITHKSVRETYLATQSAAELRGAIANIFNFGGITFERYRTGRKAKAASGSDFIALDEARLVVTGVPDLFIERYAPADYEETVNTMGLPRYAKQWGDLSGKSRHVEMQTNPFILCTQPRTLKRIVLA